jgi:hypothetical protein
VSAAALRFNGEKFAGRNAEADALLAARSTPHLRAEELL